MRGLALGGFMGTGKSTVGRRVARAQGVPFVDVDELLVAEHGAIARQFARDGEAAFRARECAVIARLCDGVVRVVATGGGAWVDPQNRRTLAGGHVRVVLAASLETLEARLQADGGARPLWDDAVARRWRERQAAYADADLVVDTDHLDAVEVARRVEAAWVAMRA